MPKPSSDSAFHGSRNLQIPDPHSHSVCPYPPLLLLCISKQLPDVGLRLPHVFVEDFRAVDHLWLPGIEHLPDLPRHQRLAAARGPVQQDPLHVLAACKDREQAQRGWDTALTEALLQGAGRDGPELCSEIQTQNSKPASIRHTELELLVRNTQHLRSLGKGGNNNSDQEEVLGMLLIPK